MGRRDRKQEIIKKVAIGSSVAAVAGYVAGVLTAPKSGKQTRSDIKSAANNTVNEAEKDLKKLHTELGDLVDDAKKNGSKLSIKAKKEADDIVEKAKDSKEKVREMISAVREGSAEDKDLERAVKESKKAIAHLRSFLKK